jgi:hypothetical protein
MLVLGLRMFKKSVGHYIKKNKGPIAFLCFVIFGLSFYVNCAFFFIDQPETLKFFPPFVKGLNLNHNKHLGAEYYFIAQSIAEGKGFSNPFQVETGPTSWMPPVYPIFLATLIELFHDKLLVAACVVFLKNMVLIGVGLLAYEIAKKTLYVLKPGVILAIYTLFLLGNFRWYFQITHDEWLLLLLICIIFPLAVRFNRNTISPSVAIIWGIVGGFAMLANPVIGLSWIVLSLINFLSHKNVRALIVSLLLFSSLCSLWVIRNYSVFNRFILIKSNFYYEAYIYNYNTTDGLFDEEFTKKHPVWQVKDDPQTPYRKLGEIQFLDTYRKKFFSAFKQDPHRYLSNIKNRLLSALIIYYPYNKYEYWSILFNGLLHPLPFLCLIFILCSRVHRSSDYFKTALLIYTIYLIPYIIVSYYVRYGIPLTLLKLLFCAWAVDLIMIATRKEAARQIS